MDYKLQFLSKFTSWSSSFMYGEDPAVVFDQELQSWEYCAICLSDICGGDRYRKLQDCGHCFHAQCIDSWLKCHSTCPLCRNQLISLNDENRCDLGAFISNVGLLFQNFVERMCNPALNDDLTSMLCGASIS